MAERVVDAPLLEAPLQKPRLSLADPPAHRPGCAKGAIGPGLLAAFGEGEAKNGQGRGVQRFDAKGAAREDDRCAGSVPGQGAVGGRQRAVGEAGRQGHRQIGPGDSEVFSQSLSRHGQSQPKSGHAERDVPHAAGQPPGVWMGDDRRGHRAYFEMRRRARPRTAARPALGASTCAGLAP